MLDILAHIIGYAFYVFLFLGIISIVLAIFSVIWAAFSSKPTKGAPSSMPWWVWWTSYRDK
jgi:hypothetical protein